jgi:hypothetical protein
MKIVSFVLILFSFFATFADGVFCISHDFYKSEDVISFVSAVDSNTQNSQSDFSPFDHCETCPDSCHVNLAFIINSYKEKFHSSPLITKITFIHKGLRLNTFLGQRERPPTLV